MGPRKHAQRHQTRAKRKPQRGSRWKPIIRASWACLCGMLELIYGAGRAQAQPVPYDYWTQPAGGSWENTSYWGLGVTPAQGGSTPFGPYYAEFNLASGSAYTVTMGQAEDAGEVDVYNNFLTLNTSGSALELEGNVNITATAGQIAGFTFNGTSVDGTDGSKIESYLGTFLIGGSGQTFISVNNALIQSDHGSNFYNFGAGSTVTFNNAALFAQHAAMSVGGTTTFNASSATMGNDIIVGNTQALPATLDLSGGSSVSTVSAILIGFGTINVNGSYLSATGLDEIAIGYGGSDGVLNVTNGGAVNTGDAAINIGSPGGTGTLNVTGTGSIAHAYTQIAVEQGGTLTVGSGGKILAPDLNMSQGSTLAIGLDEGGISITGLATLAGTLDVTLGSVPDPTLGETFDLITFGSETGTFTAIELPPLDPGLGWSTQQLYTNGEISVVSAIPEPAKLGLVVIATLWPLARRTRRSWGKAI